MDGPAQKPCEIHKEIYLLHYKEVNYKYLSKSVKQVIFLLLFLCNEYFAMQKSQVLRLYHFTPEQKA